MRYSIQPKDRVYVKGYGLSYFAKNMDKNLSNKYGQKLFDTAKIFTTDSKTPSKRAIQKTGEATGYLIGNKIANEITNASMELHSKKCSKELPNDETEVYVKRATNKKKCISPEEKQKIIDELRLVL